MLDRKIHPLSGNFFLKFNDNCYKICITKERKQGDMMLVELIHIDFNSDEAIYMQLRNQIILGIATSKIREGETLPSVRQLADIIGINMHTVNKAYAVLKQDGFVSIDRRKGAVICIDADKILALRELKDELRVALAKGWCKNISKEEIHALIDEIFEEYC